MSSQSADDLDGVSIADPKIQACPYHFYALMRSQEPVHYDPVTDLWMIAGYGEVKEVLRNWQVFSSVIDMRTDVGGPDMAETNELFERHGYIVPDVLSQVDPPLHTFFRSLVDRTFTAPVVKHMNDYLVDHAHEMIDSFIDRGDCNFKEEFASPLPLGVIADQLGAPRSDMALFRKWTDAIIETLGIMLTPERRLECTKLMIEFQHYFVARIEEKKAAPQDDILSALVAARHEDGRELTIEELLALIQQLLVAGNETTRSHLIACMALLIEHRDLQDLLSRDPALIPKFVEESLRLESPVQGLFRKTKQETVLAGKTIPAGAKLYVCYGSANRDDVKFPRAEALDIHRSNASQHMAFSYGIHRCIGQALARKELAIGLAAILERMTNIQLSPQQGPIRHVPSFILRGIESLHITFDKRA